MTIEEYKAKLDEYYGMVGFLDEGKPENPESECYYITYYSPIGRELFIHRIVRTKLGKIRYWYPSGSRISNIPGFDTGELNT